MNATKTRDITDRLYRKGVLAKELTNIKAERIRNLKEKEEVDRCTFSPSARASKSFKTKNQQTELLNRLIRFKPDKETRLKILRE